MQGQERTKRGLRYGTWLFVVLGLLLSSLGLVPAPDVSAQITPNVAISSALVQDLDGTFFIEVTLTAGTTVDDAVTGVRFDLSYDPGLIKPILNTDPFSGTVGAPACETLAGASGACGPVDPNGQIAISLFLADGAWTGDNVIARIPFEGCGLEGVTELEVSGLDVVGFDPQSLPATSENGTVTLEEPRGSISDFVFNDLDGDGIQDVGEPGVTGAVVSLADAAGSPVAGQPAQTTGVDGTYLFDDLPAGGYIVTFAPPTGFDLTLQDQGADDAVDSDPDPATGEVSVTLAAGDIVDDVDAGVVPEPVGSISNLVFEDVDGDGLQDVGEPGIAGVVVNLLDGAGNSTGQSTTTDPSGEYSFGDLPEGDYIVEFVAPTGRVFTTPLAGNDDTVDSNAGADGQTAVISLDPGQDDETVDAGILAEPPVVGLAKSLTAGPTETVAGLSFTYTFIIENLGDVALSGIGLSDDFAAAFPGGTVVSGPAPDGGDCSAAVAAGTGALGIGASCTAVWTVVVSGLTEGQTYTNSATVTASAPDGTTATDTASADVTIPIPPDVPVVGLVKSLTAGPTETAAGWSFTYTFAIENQGDVALSGIGLSDDFAAAFPGGTVVSGPTPDGGDCSSDVAGGTGALAVGASCTAVWTVVVSGLDAGETYTNSATVTASAPDGTIDTDTATADATIPVPPDVPVVGLAKSLTAGPTETAAGLSFTYTFIIENLGDVALSGIALDDNFAAAFPGGTVVSGPTPDGGDCSAAVAAGTGALGIGASCTAVWTVVVSGLTEGQTYTNSATVTASAPDGTIDTDTATADATIPIPPDVPVVGLVKSLTAGPTETAAGWSFTYTFAIENLGDVALSGIVLDDNFAAAFPDGTVVSGPAPDGGDCSAEVVGAPGHSLAVGASCTAVWTVVVSGLDAGETYTNSATVTASAPDGTIDTDTATADATIPVPPDVPVVGLAKSLTAGPTETAAGWSFTYTFAIENLGDVALVGVTLDDNFAAAFPGGTVVSGPAPDGGDCSAEVAGGTGALAVGASCTAVWTVVVSGLTEGQTYTNSATVTASAPDGTIDTDTATADATIPIPPDVPVVGLVKSLTAGPTETAAGWSFTYTFAIENLGDVALSGIVLDDNFAAAFPDGTVVSGPAPDGGDCSAEVVGAPGHSLAVGASCTAVWTVVVSGLDAGETYTNSATVTASAPDGTIDTDTATADATIPVPPDVPVVGLAKSLTAGPTETAAGWSFTYTFAIENLGDVALVGVTLDDNFAAAFPGGTVVSGPAPDGGDCSADVADGTGALAVGASCTAVWTVVVSGLTEGATYTNSATVTAASADGITDTDTASAEATIPVPPDMPVVGLAKSLTAGPTETAAGWSFTYTFAIENQGDVALSGIVLDDNFAAAFPGGTVESGPAPDGGDCSAEVAGGTGALAVGASCTAVWTVVVSGLDPGETYTNTATVTASAPDGTSDSDTATAVATIPVPPGTPAVGLTKSLTAGPTETAAGWSFTYTFAIENLGDVALSGIGLSDDFAAAFPGGALASVPTPDGGDCSTEVATGSATLAVGASCTAVWTVVVSGLDAGATYTNTATVTASAPDGASDTDTASADATIPAPPAKAVLGDRVFIDSNGDGIQDPGEASFPGVTVVVRDADGNDVGGATTDANGQWSVEVDAGTYTIVFTAPNGYSFSPVGAGGDPGVDNNAKTDGTTDPITVVAGATETSVDAGLVPLGTLGGAGVFFDANGDGVRTAGETAIANVTLSLRDAAGNPVPGQPDQVTGADGAYEFANLAAGNYILVVSPPAGFVLGPQNAGGDDATDSDIDPTTGQSAVITIGIGQTISNVGAGLVLAPSPPSPPVVPVQPSSPTLPIVTITNAPPSGAFPAQPAAPASPTGPGLAVTGASSNLLASLAIAMTAVGATLTTSARRKRDDWR